MPDPLIATCELKTASYDLDGNPSPISLVTFTGKKILDSRVEVSGSITFPETRTAFTSLFTVLLAGGPANLIPPVSQNDEVIGGTPFVPMQPTNGGPAITASPLGFGGGYGPYYSTQNIPAGSTYNFKLGYGHSLDSLGTYLAFGFYQPNQIFTGQPVREEVAYTLSNQSSCFGFPSSSDTLVKKTSLAILGTTFYNPAIQYEEVSKEPPGILLDSDVNPLPNSNYAALQMAPCRTPAYTFISIGKFSGWAQKISGPLSGIAQAQIGINGDGGGGLESQFQFNQNTTEPQFFELERSRTNPLSNGFTGYILLNGQWRFWGLEFEVSSVVSGVCSNEGYTPNEIALNWGPAPPVTLAGINGNSQATDLDQLTEPYPDGWTKSSFGTGNQIHHAIAPFSVPSDGPARANMSLFLRQGNQAYLSVYILKDTSTATLNDMVNNPSVHAILSIGSNFNSIEGFNTATADLSDYLGETLYVYFRVLKLTNSNTPAVGINVSDFSFSIDTCAPTPQKDQRLFWDVIGERVYENGVDRGVLYLPDGRAVVWNGLLSVEEDSGSSTQGVFYDGVKISEIVNMGDYSAKLSAITYPDELDDLQGVAQLVEDVYLTDQPLKTFGLSYRTRILDDISQEPIGYKIHIVYNVIAVPTDIGYETLSDDPSAMEFQWDLVALSGFIDGFRPTAKFVVDTTKINPDLLIELEKLLYGTSTVQPALPTMQELLEYIRTWYTIQIIDNGDGTWTATSDNDGYIFVDVPQEDQFMIVDVNATFLDDETYIISDT
jgi:hypothetical protein